MGRFLLIASALLFLGVFLVLPLLAVFPGIRQGVRGLCNRDL